MFLKKNTISLIIIINLVFFFLLCLALKANEVKILFKINDKIATNIDIENEFNYLTSLNPTLKNIDKSQVLSFAKNSLLKEIVKKFEISKFYELNKKNESVDIMIEKIFKNLGINSEEEFKKYLNENNLNFNEVYQKIEIEAVWNQMIYSRFKDKIFIDENKIKEKVLSNPKKIEELLLSEIIIEFKNKGEVQNIYNQIIKSIDDIGFEETVIKFSISNSKNKSGSLGWINKNSLSKNIIEELNDIDVGEITKPILVSSGMMILKLNDKKLVQQDINIDQEINKMIDYEMNKQLNNLSNIHYNKIKSNLIINEY
jgi:peptidyl-prolyl cis-trans isomerase SurA